MGIILGCGSEATQAGDGVQNWNSSDISRRPSSAGQLFFEARRQTAPAAFGRTQRPDGILKSGSAVSVQGGAIRVSRKAVQV
jgi:hypothetical protein